MKIIHFERKQLLTVWFRTDSEDFVQILQNHSQSWWFGTGPKNFALKTDDLGQRPRPNPIKSSTFKGKSLWRLIIWERSPGPETFIQIHQNYRFLKENPSKNWWFGTGPENVVQTQRNRGLLKENPSEDWIIDTGPENFAQIHQNHRFPKENHSKKWRFGTDAENSVKIHQDDWFLKDNPSKKWGFGTDPKNSIQIHQNDRFLKEPF